MVAAQIIVTLAEAPRDGQAGDEPPGAVLDSWVRRRRGSSEKDPLGRGRSARARRASSSIPASRRCNHALPCQNRCDGWRWRSGPLIPGCFPNRAPGRILPAISKDRSRPSGQYCRSRLACIPKSSVCALRSCQSPDEPTKPTDRFNHGAKQASADAWSSRCANKSGVPSNSPTQAVFSLPWFPRCGASRTWR
jgi:hypothetical protein